jgi:hypothetical protein
MADVERVAADHRDAVHQVAVQPAVGLAEMGPGFRRIQAAETAVVAEPAVASRINRHSQNRLVRQAIHRRLTLG